jgi:YbbR domain-containing protein
MIRYLLLAKDFFLRNFHMKLTSVLLALLLWVAINGEPQSAIVLKVPLEYRNYPKGIEVLGDTLNTVDVRLSASSSLIKRLDPADIAAVINLSDWSLGERTYSITPDNIRVPHGASLTKITPNKVRLKFEPTRRKIVEIRPRITGKLAEGYEIESVLSHPGEVQIEGPEGHLTAIEFVSTDSVDVSGRSDSFETRAHLYVEDQLVRFPKEQETTVEVIITPLPVQKNDIRK